VGNNSGEVFISYSHDNVEHARRVLDLSNKLRSAGIDCVLDQYEKSPPGGWPRWMDKKIRDAHYVLMIITETYYKRVMGEEETGKGLGVIWEGSLIYNYIYNSGTSNTKFIPCIFDVSHQCHIPTPIKGATFYCVSTPEGYDDLYYRLLNKTKTEKPKLGKRRALPQKEVKTDFADIFEKQYIYQGLKSLIERGDGTGFHNADLGHPVYRAGASDASEEMLKDWEYADSPKNNLLFKMLSKLTKELKQSGIEDMRFIWWYDFSKWSDFCKFATDVYDKKRGYKKA
jgi:hypothetical protein